jgi:tetratricopeptide (TPR) repeat protein
MRSLSLAALLILSFSTLSFGQVKPKPTAGSAAAGARSISVVTQPGAVVYIDGIRYGKANSSGVKEIRSISSGAHSIKVRLDGFKERSQPLAAAQRGEVRVELVKTTDEAELAFQEAERMTSVDREKAAEAYRRAVKLRPGFVDAQIGLARVLTEAGDIEDASTAILSARKMRPGYAEASAVEGRIHKENGDDEKAIAAFKRAITEGKGFQPEAYTGLGLLYKEKAEAFGGAGDFENEEKNYTEAARNLKIALKQLSGAPDAMVIYQLLGLVFERQKKYADAISLYEEFLRLFPDSTDATAVRSFIVQLRKDMSAQP